MNSESIEPYLEAYQVSDDAPEIVPGVPRRDWMDIFQDRHPYRCLPLTMANSTGWQLLCPYRVDIKWNGGKRAEDLIISSPDVSDPHAFAQSHFREGIVTFHTNYVFRTPPGWAVQCGGPPNWPKHGVYPLSGLVETDWLPFPFTMNWQMTKAGKVTFEKGEPYCFIALTEHNRLEQIEPKLKTLAANKQLKADYDAWNHNRAEFLKRLNLNEKTAVADGWQKNYMKGENDKGTKMSDSHVTSRRMKTPKDLRGSAVFLKY